MDEKRTTMPLIVGIVVVLVLLCGYVGGYFALSEPATLQHENSTPIKVRNFKYRLLATLYKPAAFVESKLTGETRETRAFDRRGYPVGLPIPQ